MPIEREPVSDVPGSVATNVGLHNNHNSWVMVVHQLPHMILKVGLQRSPAIPSYNIHD